MAQPTVDVDETSPQRLDTPGGIAELWHHPVPHGNDIDGTALLLHGAGASSDTADLLALAASLTAAGVRVVRLDQPYRVAARASGGRRPPAPAATLDAVVRAVATTLPGPLLLAGRSSGARVACRTASSLGAAGVVALGFPLAPPGSGDPSVRVAELAGAGVPVLVLQGSRDTFGGPADVAALGLPGVEVHGVAAADHSFRVRKADARPQGDVLAEVASIATGWSVVRLESAGKAGR